MTFSNKESLCINRANSLLMLLIVLMHCVVSNDVPYEEFFYVCIFRTFTRVAVPVFFLMSGYLLLNNYTTSKIRKRVDTVLIPYILWSLLSVGFFLFMSKMPVVSNYINADIRFTITDILRRTLISPINGALWFLRDLFLLICQQFMATDFRLSLTILQKSGRLTEPYPECRDSRCTSEAKRLQHREISAIC